MEPAQAETPTPLRVVDGNELGRTYDCRVRGCVNTSESNRGRYAYLCATHQRERKAAARHAAALAPRDGFVDKVKALLPIARRLDQARKKAEPIARELAAAKAEWIRAVEELSL